MPTGEELGNGLRAKLDQNAAMRWARIGNCSILPRGETLRLEASRGRENWKDLDTNNSHSEIRRRIRPLVRQRRGTRNVEIC